MAVLSNKRLYFIWTLSCSQVITKPQAQKYFLMTPAQLNSIPHAKATLAMSSGLGSNR